MTDQTRELALQVKKVRDLQRKYFRDRTPQSLGESKDAERRLDAVVDDILSGANLFDEQMKGAKTE